MRAWHSDRSLLGVLPLMSTTSADSLHFLLSFSVIGLLCLSDVALGTFPCPIFSVCDFDAALIGGSLLAQILLHKVTHLRRCRWRSTRQGQACLTKYFSKNLGIAYGCTQNFSRPAALCVKNIQASNRLVVKSLLLRLSSMTLLFAKQRKQLARISCKSQTSKIIRT